MSENRNLPAGSMRDRPIALDVQSVLRLRIFLFKMLMVIPVSSLIAAGGGMPVLNLFSIFCVWHAVFAAVAAFVQRQRFTAISLTAWDEAAAFFLVALFARLVEANAA